MVLALIISAVNAQEIKKRSSQGDPQGSSVKIEPKFNNKADKTTALEKRTAIEQKKAEERVKPANTQPQIMRTHTNTGFTYVPFNAPTHQNAPAADPGMVSITLTAGDIWGDGSGYQMLLDPTATAYGSIIPATGALYSCSAPANLYDIFTYKIPTNADPVCTTSNIVVNNSITIQIPAGTYDWCIVNPTSDPQYPNLWIAGSAGNTSARADNYVFQEGKKYTFVMTTNGNNDGVNLTITDDYSPNVPKAVTNLTVTPVGTNQASITWTNPTQTVGGAALTALTAVKLYVNNSTTPVYTNSSPVVGGAGSYTYNIPTPGGYKFTVVASNAAGAGVEASVTHDFCDVLTSLSEGFEGTYPPACWTPYQNSFTQSSTYAAEGTKSIMLVTSSTFKTYGLITPPLHMQAAELSFKMLQTYFWGSSSYYNTVKVKVSTTDNQESSFTTIKEFSTYNYSGINSNNVILTSSNIGGTSLWYEAKVNLSAYAGQTIYVALEAYDHYGADFYIDDVQIYPLSANDAAITAIITPASGQNLTATETVKATIKNNGSNPITTLGMELTVDGTVITTTPETFTGNIAAGATYDYIFTAKANLLAAGNHTVKVRAILTGDGNPANDSYTKTVTNTICTIITSFPYTEGFEVTSDLVCWSIYNLVSASTVQWAPSLTYAHSGINSMKAPYDCSNGVDNWLVSPPITVPTTGNYVLQFWSINDYPGDAEYDGVLISTTGNNPSTSTFTQVKQLTGDELSTNWQQFTIPLNAYAGQTIYIAFNNQGTCADAWYIDDVKVYNFQNYKDAEVKSIDKPASGPNLTATEQIRVTVKNNGSDPITSLPISVTIDGGTPINETITTPIASFAEYTYIFTATANLSTVSTHTISATVALPGDQDATNNTKTKSVTNFGNVVLLQEGDNGTVTTCNIKFTDNGGITNDYYYYDNGIVVFYPATAGKMLNATINDLALGTDWGQDALFIFDGAYTMDELYAMTSDQIAAIMLLGAAGDWGSECPMYYEATNPDGALTFYFQLGTWFGTTDRGWDIDVTCSFDNDASITAITAPPVNGQNMTATETVKAIIRNSGVNPISSVGMQLTVDGVVVTTTPETYTGTIAAGATYEYTFTAKANLLAAGNHTVTVKVIYAGDENPANDSKTINVINTICNNIATLPYTEDFESGILGCWTTTKTHPSPASNWHVGPETSGTCDNCGTYIATLEYTDAQMMNERLISPSLNLSAYNGQEITLSFDLSMSYYWHIDPNQGAVLNVEVSKDNGATWTEIWNQTDPGVFENWVWYNRTADMSAYAGSSNVKISFKYVGDDGAAIYLDNILVKSSGGSSVPIVNGNEINIFQNNGNINVLVSEKSEIRVLDILGRVLGSYNVEANSTLKVHLPSGIYLFEVRSNGGVSTHKVVVK